MFKKKTLGLLFIYFRFISPIITLTCFVNDKFNSTNPGEETQQCKEGEVCIRYTLVENKNQKKEKDIIKCGTMDECNIMGVSDKASSDAVTFYCNECKEDKCIPESAVDNQSDSSQFGSEGSGNNETENAPTIETTTFDDKDDPDDEEEEIVKKKPEKPKNTVQSSRISSNFYLLISISVSKIQLYSFSKI
ncbi:hypothetical protein HHI36_016714 [Cryptolaemus montrouzieri]|uniref:Uncharacterized protein n=1 Tax=Cryptolaemus montrouzieri TaxID=559131 RepID=A0ABD2NKG6_9CUCU